MGDQIGLRAHPESLVNVLVQRQTIDQTQPLSPDKINTRAKLLTVKSRSTSVVGSEDEGPVPIK